MTSTTKAHLSLLGTNIFFAINYTAVKYIINGGFIKPFGLNIVRVGITALLLWALYFFRPKKTIVAKKDYKRFFLCALSRHRDQPIAFYQRAFAHVFHSCVAADAYYADIMITFIAAWILKERLTNYKLIGLSLGIAGALVLILLKEKTGNPSEVMLGDIFIILNAISYTFYFVLVKPLMKEYDPIMVLRIVFSIGFFLMLPFCFREFTRIPWQAYSIKEFFVLALIVIGGTFLAYLLNIYGIKVLGASIAGAYIYSQPLFAAAIAVFFLGEELNAL